MTYQPRDDFNKSILACYEAIRNRVAAGGPGWKPKEVQLQRPLATQSLTVRSPGPPFGELSITAEDGHHVYLLTRRQLRLLIRTAMEVESRIG
jgi:hypothetical protein